MATDCGPEPPGSRALYDNLDGERNFRLVRLSPDSAESQPSFELKTVAVDDDVTYTALSYVWGPPEPTYSADLDGHAISVRKNLWMFLTEVAGAKTADWFFIDAVCINQNDLDECAAQVRLMGGIYRNAQEVRIWIPFLGEWWWRMSRGWKLWTPRYTKFSPDNDYTDREVKEYENESNPERAEEARIKLAAKFRIYIIRNVYWLRLWIVQELLLAKKLTFQWRSLSFG